MSDIIFKSENFKKMCEDNMFLLNCEEAISEKVYEAAEKYEGKKLTDRDIEVLSNMVWLGSSSTLKDIHDTIANSFCKTLIYWGELQIYYKTNARAAKEAILELIRKAAYAGIAISISENTTLDFRNIETYYDVKKRYL